jgi:hypothetical protein
MSSYKELKQLKLLAGKYFDNYEKLTPEGISKMKRLNRHITITEADLLRKAFDRQNKIRQAIQEKEDSNIMNLLSRGE